MSNSSLVSYTKISPNKTHPRKNAIDTITIHHMAGNLTVEKCGELFANPSRQASSNYGIGSDGRIALYVDEGDRSWCSGTGNAKGSNDHRAVTIEVANDNTKTWSISDAAMKSLIELVADICKRNNIKELKWKADKKLVGKIDQQNMTVHRWFQATACPGDYLYGKMGDIAKAVNEKLGVKVDKPPVPMPTIKYGSKGTAAKNLQMCLNFLGAGLVIDGIFGQKSTEALRQWQKKYGLVADGIYGAKSYAKMKELI